MTTTYELYTNENGTPKAVEGKAPAILERVEALEETLDNGVVTSVNSQTGDVTVDVGVTSFNGSKGAVTYSAPVSSVNGKTGAVTVDVGVTSVNGKTGAVTVGTVRSVNGTSADASGNVTISVPATPKAYVTETWKSGTQWYRKWSDGWIEQGGKVLGTKTWTTRNLNTAFTTTNYTLLGTNGGQSTDENFYSNTAQVKPVSTTTFKSAVYGANGIENIYWYACGY